MEVKRVIKLRTSQGLAKRIDFPKDFDELLEKTQTFLPIDDTKKYQFIDDIYIFIVSTNFITRPQLCLFLFASVSMNNSRGHFSPFYLAPNRVFGGQTYELSGTCIYILEHSKHRSCLHQKNIADTMRNKRPQ